MNTKLMNLLIDFGCDFNTPTEQMLLTYGITLDQYNVIRTICPVIATKYPRESSNYYKTICSYWIIEYDNGRFVLGNYRMFGGLNDYMVNGNSVKGIVLQNKDNKYVGFIRDFSTDITSEITDVMIQQIITDLNNINTIPIQNTVSPAQYTWFCNTCRNLHINGVVNVCPNIPPPLPSIPTDPNVIALQNEITQLKNTIDNQDKIIDIILQKMKTAGIN